MNEYVNVAPLYGRTSCGIQIWQWSEHEVIMNIVAGMSHWHESEVARFLTKQIFMAQSVTQNTFMLFDQPKVQLEVS